MKGCCGTCAWLSKCLMPGGKSEQPKWAVYDETEHWYRDNPGEDFTFVPLGYNSDKQGRLQCFRHVADLPKEAAERGLNAGQPRDPAWVAVVWLDRHCPKWSPWEAGVPPREQFADERQRKFTKDIKEAETRLTWIAIGVAVIVGLILMTSDTVGWKALDWLFRPFGWLRYW